MSVREGADEVVDRGPCSDCGSKDNLVTYQDGHQTCYSPGCGLKKKADDSLDEEATTPKKPKGDYIPFTSEFMPEGLKSRHLKLDTLAKFGYFINKKGGQHYHIAPYFNQTGDMALQKYRDKDKRFWFEPVMDEAPQPKNCQLFAQQVWGEKYDRKVVICEGEIDAMSVAQATKFKIAVVSIPNGINSAKDALKANYRWLDRFEEIILWFDNDDPGQEPIDECATLFTVGKVKTIRLPNVKDASDLLQAGKEGDVYAAVWAATVWAPEGIVNARDCLSDMEEPAAVTIAEYPWPTLQEVTMGMREGEVVYHVAGTGVGKTSMLNEIQWKLLEQGVKFGVMRFEDTRQKAQLDLMSIYANERLHLSKDSPTDQKKRLMVLHSEVFDGGLVELFDPETADWGFDAIFSYIRYMVKALDCKVIFIDPLSFVVAAANERDERKALDHVAYQFGRDVKQLGCNLQVSHHLNRGDGKAFEEGGEISLKNIRGSAGIANFSMAIFGYERNQQGDRPDLTQIRVLKGRHTGFTGIADVLKWDEPTGRQLVSNEPYPTSDDQDSGFGAAPQATGTADY